MAFDRGVKGTAEVRCPATALDLVVTMRLASLTNKGSHWMTSHISNTNLKAFADKKINLKIEEVSAGRDRVRFLRKRLEDHIANNPGFSLVKNASRRQRGQGNGSR